MMMSESHGIPYGFEQRLPGATFGTALERVTAALQTEGFGVLTEIDVTKTLKNKLGVHIPPYVVLGACRRRRRVMRTLATGDAR